MTDLYLYVDNEDSTGAWATVGTTPYISTQNQPTDYIYDTGRNNDSGVYSFPASGHSTETINSVTLYIYAYGVATSDFEAYLGASATGLGPPAGAWQWVSVDVSGILTTWAQIDAATVYFDRPNTTNEAGVDACYLLVDYTEGDLAIDKTDNVTLGESVTLDVSDPQIDVSSDLTVGDTVVDISPTAEGVDAEMSDNINIGDSIIISVNDPNINVADNLTLGENVSGDTIDPQITVSDSLAVGDTSNATIPEAQPDLSVNVSFEDYSYWIQGVKVR